MIWILAWWLTGVFAILWSMHLYKGEIVVADLLICLLLAIFGPFMLLLPLGELLGPHMRTVVRRKK